MKKVILILVLLLLSGNAYAGKAKPGSGPLMFSEKEVEHFHLYITKKLNKDALKEYGLPGFSFNYSSPVFYANHFVVRGTYKSVFQWDHKDRGGGPQKDWCSGPECKIFAKKNKIVWKGAKTKIPRDITLSQLKLVLKDLGFYDEEISQVETKTTEKSKTKTKTKVEANKKIEKETNILDEIKELNQLYKDGVLTKEQFEKAKNKLLN